jgi:hypothetical protein
MERIKGLDCKVLKEWIEKEWRFKELANDQKFYTGRTYPSREYAYTVVLQDGRKIEETSVSGIFYMIEGDYGPDAAGGPRKPQEPVMYMIHKRDKGDYGDTLESLSYVKVVRLGEEAFKEGKARAGKGGHGGAAKVRKKAAQPAESP